jgi:hypothetical protein
MFNEFAKSLLPSLLTEAFTLGLAYITKNNKLVTFLILAIGSFLAWYIGFYVDPNEVIAGNPGLAIQTETASPILGPGFLTVPLAGWSELASAQTNLGMTPGRNILNGVPFETGWTASTQCVHLPDQPEVITLDIHTANVRNVYLLLQAGWGLKQYYAQGIGYVRLTFESGQEVTTELILGTNIRDWAWENPDAVTTYTSDNLSPAWEGVTSEGEPGGMDILTIPVPPEYSSSELLSIEIRDLSQSWEQNINPCIHLDGLTVEYAQ